MPSGQTQKVYGDEQPLAPESVRDIHRMLGESRLTSQIRKHRTVSGVMFFEVSRAHWIERRGYAPYFRYHLVAGEDPKEKGCLVSMHLSRPAQYLIPLHMKSMWDTRGGIPNIAWCSAFQFKRKIFPSGTNSRSYTAIRRARRDYCKELLRVFDDSLSFENQNWQAIQNIIDEHKRLFQECRCEQCRMRRFEVRAGSSDSDDDDNDNDNDPNNRNDHPRSDSKDSDDDDSDDDDGNQRGWRQEVNRLRRRRALGSAAKSSEDNSQDDDQNLTDMVDDASANVDMEDDAIDEDFDLNDYATNTDEILFSDGSQSPLRFVPHSREASPDLDAHPTTENDNLDDEPNMDYNYIFDMDIDRAVTPPWPTMPDSPIQPKLEPRVEPEPDLMTSTEHTGSGRTCNLIDLTGDDDSIESWNNGMEIIELTEDSDTTTEPARPSNTYAATIDLTQDSEESQCGSDMQVIELDE